MTYPPHCTDDMRLDSHKNQNDPGAKSVRGRVCRSSGWCRGADLNCRHTDFQSVALPTELRYLAKCGCKYIFIFTIRQKKIYKKAFHLLLFIFKVVRCICLLIILSKKTKRV